MVGGDATVLNSIDYPVDGIPRIDAKNQLLHTDVPQAVSKYARRRAADFNAGWAAPTVLRPAVYELAL